MEDKRHAEISEAGGQGYKPEIGVLVLRSAEVFRIMAENFEILSKTDANAVDNGMLENLFKKYSLAGLTDFASRTLTIEERVSRRQYEAIMLYLGIQAVKQIGDLDFSWWLYDCTRAMRNISQPLERFRAGFAMRVGGETDYVKQFYIYEAKVFGICSDALKDLVK